MGIQPDPSRVVFAAFRESMMRHASLALVGVHAGRSPPLPCQQGPDLGMISVEEYSISIIRERESPCQGTCPEGPRSSPCQECPTPSPNQTLCRLQRTRSWPCVALPFERNLMSEIVTHLMDGRLPFGYGKHARGMCAPRLSTRGRRVLQTAFTPPGWPGRPRLALVFETLELTELVLATGSPRDLKTGSPDFSLQMRRMVKPQRMRMRMAPTTATGITQFCRSSDCTFARAAVRLASLSAASAARRACSEW